VSLAGTAQVGESLAARGGRCSADRAAWACPATSSRPSECGSDRGNGFDRPGAKRGVGSLGTTARATILMPSVPIDFASSPE